MIAQTAEVREAHRFDTAALERYMRARVEGFSGTLEVRQFLSGRWPRVRGAPEAAW